MSHYYFGNHSCGHQYTASIAIDQKILNEVLQDYFDGKFEAGEIHHKLWEASYRTMSDGVLTGHGKISYTNNDIELINELKHNVAVYSAFKAHDQSKELQALLVDPEGKKRSWYDFRKEAAKVDDKYNKQWLEAEYNYATRAARSAKQWHEFERTSDLYPNLEYMPSRSASPRQSHQPYYGVVKPISDPFWDTMLPPNGWGCKCSVRKTKAGETGGSIEPAEQVPGIPGNSGKAKKIFTKDHPIVRKASKDERLSVQKQFREVYDLEDDYARIPVGKKGMINAHARAHKVDVIANKDYGVALVKRYGGELTIRPHQVSGKKNPEYNYKNTIGDRTAIESTSTRSYINNTFKAKLGKNGQLRDLKKCFLAFDFLGQLNKSNMNGSVGMLSAKLNHYKTVSFVVLKNGNKTLKIDRKDFDKLHVKLKEELL